MAGQFRPIISIILAIFPPFSLSLVGVQVTMADKEAAERACETPNPVIEGRRANVNLAYLGAKPRMMGCPPGNNTAVHLMATHEKERDFSACSSIRRAYCHS